MSNVIIAGMATALILNVVETFIYSLGKWRGLLALGAAFGGLGTLGIKLSYLPVYGLATTFLGLVLSLSVEQIFSGVDAKQLPKRIPVR